MVEAIKLLPEAEAPAMAMTIHAWFSVITDIFFSLYQNKIRAIIPQTVKRGKVREKGKFVKIGSLFGENVNSEYNTSYFPY